MAKRLEILIKPGTAKLPERFSEHFFVSENQTSLRDLHVFFGDKIHGEYQGIVRLSLADIDLNPRVENDTGNITYLDTKSGKWITLKAGKFARKFFVDPEGKTLPDTKIQEFAELVKTMCKRYEFKIADTAEKIAEVYRDGPNSCMSSSRIQQFGVRSGKYHHPAEVYATEDFEVHYATDKVQDNKIVARCLVSKKGKGYSTIYGLNTILENHFEKLGIEPCEGNRPFGGHRVRKIAVTFDAHTIDYENYLMPYVDRHFGVLTDTDNDEYFVLTGEVTGRDSDQYWNTWDREHCTDNTSGCTGDCEIDDEYFGDEAACEHCDDLVPETELCDIDIRDGGSGEITRYALCEHCQIENIIQDDSYQNDEVFFFENDDNIVRTESGTFRIDETSYCDDCECDYHENETTCIQVMDGESGVSEPAILCEHCQSNYHQNAADPETYFYYNDRHIIRHSRPGSDNYEFYGEYDYGYYKAVVDAENEAAA